MHSDSSYSLQSDLFHLSTTLPFISPSSPSIHPRIVYLYIASRRCQKAGRLSMTEMRPRSGGLFASRCSLLAQSTHLTESIFMSSHSCSSSFPPLPRSFQHQQCPHRPFYHRPRHRHRSGNHRQPASASWHLDLRASRQHAPNPRRGSPLARLPDARTDIPQENPLSSH